MPIDISGATIAISGSGISLNSTLIFDSNGRAQVSTPIGYCGWKSAAVNGNYYSGVSGWEINNVTWTSGHLNTSTGVFTCPVAGYYAMGYNGLHRGGSNFPVGFNTYGYSAFAKNGSMNYHSHWNLNNATNYWSTSGMSATFACGVGDTLALFINRSPSPVGPDCISQNLGMYPDAHHAVWCRLIG